MNARSFVANVMGSAARSPRAPHRVDQGRLHEAGLIPGHWLASAMAFTLAAFIALMASAHLTITASKGDSLAFGALALLIVSLRFFLRHPQTEPQRIVRDFAEFAGLFSLICFAGATASYAAAVFTTGWIDPSLDHWDQMLGFDWRHWYDATARSSALQWLGRIAYASIFVTPVLLLGHYAIAGRAADARRFIASFWLAAIMSLILFRFMPAQGPLEYLLHGHIPYMPTSGLDQSELIPMLREHSLTAINIADLRGLVDMPSFHGVSACLYIIAAWNTGKMCWPLIILNLAMLLSIPVEGTHYAIDLIAGTAIAIFAASTVRAVAMRLEHARD